MEKNDYEKALEILQKENATESEFLQALEFSKKIIKNTENDGYTDTLTKIGMAYGMLGYFNFQLYIYSKEKDKNKFILEAIKAFENKSFKEYLPIYVCKHKDFEKICYSWIETFYVSKEYNIKLPEIKTLLTSINLDGELPEDFNGNLFDDNHEIIKVLNAFITWKIDNKPEDAYYQFGNTNFKKKKFFMNKINDKLGKKFSSIENNKNPLNIKNEKDVAPPSDSIKKEVKENPKTEANPKIKNNIDSGVVVKNKLNSDNILHNTNDQEQIFNPPSYKIDDQSIQENNFLEKEISNENHLDVPFAGSTDFCNDSEVVQNNPQPIQNNSDNQNLLAIIIVNLINMVKSQDDEIKYLKNEVAELKKKIGK